MTFSWATIGKDDPLICGLPTQFGDAASAFTRIANQTDRLEDELREIRFGTSEGFAGQASAAFREAIDQCAQSLRDVPCVSREISRIFSDHEHDLEGLRQAADSALARAKTNWNRKRGAASEARVHGQRLSAIAQQIAALDCDPTASGEVQRLRSRQAYVSSLLENANNELGAADRQLDDSKSEWHSLRSQEEDLNERTSNRLKAVELWSLKDPWHEHFQRAWQSIAVAWDAISELVADLAEVLCEVLDKILDVLDFVGIFIEWIPVIGTLYKAVEAGLLVLQASAKLILVLDGRIDFTEFAIESLVGLAGLALPGGRQIAKVAKAGGKAFKRASPHIKRVARRVEDKARVVARDVRETTKNVADKLKDVGDKIGDKIEDRWVRGRLGDRLDDAVEGTFKATAGIVETGGRFAARGIQTSGTTFRNSMDSVVALLNTQLPDGVRGPVIDAVDERLSEGYQHLQDAASDALSARWEQSSRENEVERQELDRALVPCGLDAPVYFAPDFLVANGWGQLARAA